MTEAELVAAADALQAQASADDLSVAYAALEEQLRLAAREADIGSYLPGGTSSELGMAANRGDGRTFYEQFRKRLRDKLCSDEGELRKLTEFGVHATAGEIASVLLSTLHLPPEIAGLLYPVAAIIGLTHIETFCAKTA